MLGRPDPPTLLQVLEGVDGPEDLGAPDPSLGDRGHLVQRRPPGGGLGGSERHQPLAHGDRAGIDDPYRHLVGHSVSGRTGCLNGGRQGAGQVDAHHAVVPIACRGQEGFLECPRGGRRGLGKHVARLASAPELVGGELGSVHEFLGSEADRKGHDRDPSFLGQ